VRESVGIVQPPGDVSGKNFGAGRKLLDGSVEKLLAAVEGLEELGFLLVDDVLDGLGVFAHFGEKSSQKLDNCVYLIRNSQSVETTSSIWKVISY